ncbi:sperm equatorial segment protein 1-like [Gracilinanus agilis]|uniref:sperm equatorial segment protein 1-like n=1 Tax=Gracilinanus agilis TaxID=191870 RepID=UPI001CFEA950|nr:sperm equatorial segment protein 1-like [Gracilinanus agilis]
MRPNAAVLLVMLWLWPLPVVAYYMQVTSSNLSVEDPILRSYSEILKEMARKVPTSSVSSTGRATTTSSNWEREERARKTKEGTGTAWPSQPPNGMMFPGKPGRESPSQYSRKAKHGRILHSGKSSNQKKLQQDSSMKKAIALALDLLMKLALEPTQESSEEDLEKPTFQTPVNADSPAGPGHSGQPSGQESLDLALKLLEEAYEGVKQTTPGERASPGQMPLMTTLAQNYPEAQVDDLERRISQLSAEAKDQEHMKQILRSQILKKISEIKRTLKKVRPYPRAKGGAKGLSVAKRKKTARNRHKPHKSPKEKNNRDESMRIFINFLYDFKPKLNTFLNMNNVPSGLQGKAAIIFSMMSTILCQYQPEQANVKDLLEYNIRVLNMLNITAN